MNQSKQVETVSQVLRQAILDAYIEGITTFAYERDGTQYVGTDGVTLKAAIEAAKHAYAEGAKS